MKKTNFISVLFIIFMIFAAAGAYALLYRYNFIPHKKYTNADFNITAYTSSFDRDSDGIDDQTDILNNARAYVSTNPKYKSKYYNSGYPDDEYGVCTDVVGFALKDAGYDLQLLVSQDIKQRPDAYSIDTPDANIDFRRVRNLLVYFSSNALSLTTDVTLYDQWHGGDIVIFNEHIGIVSDNRNSDGIPFVIHHAYPLQPDYEEDILETWGEILGHYRMS